MRHETLNEIGAEVAIADFANWCDEAIRTVRSERT
jgi:alpha-beta hydrolase superfamily lysophospholipase